MEPVAGIILAAGSSARMGQPKQFLLLQGKPMLQHVIDAAEQSKLSPLIVVTGAHGAHIAEALHLERSVVAHNPDHASGNMSSLAVGVDAAPEAAAYVVIMGDQPTVDPLVIEQMVRLWDHRQPWASITEYEDRIGHPFLLSRDAVATATTSLVPKRLWGLLTTEESDRVVRLVAPGRAPIDVNTPEDYERLIAES